MRKVKEFKYCVYEKHSKTLVYQGSFFERFKLVAVKKLKAQLRFQKIPLLIEWEKPIKKKPSDAE